MAFEYVTSQPAPIDYSLEFPSLRDGASLWVKKKADATAIAEAFDLWAFRNGGALVSSVRPGFNAKPPVKGWRIWIKTNEDGMRAYDFDTVEEWKLDRTEAAEETPAGGWPSVADLHSDYLTWVAERHISAMATVNINTFGRRIRGVLPARFTRKSKGVTVKGVKLKAVEE